MIACRREAEAGLLMELMWSVDSEKSGCARARRLGRGAPVSLPHMVVEGHGVDAHIRAEVGPRDGGPASPALPRPPSWRLAAPAPWQSRSARGPLALGTWCAKLEGGGVHGFIEVPGRAAKEDIPTADVGAAAPGAQHDTQPPCWPRRLALGDLAARLTQASARPLRRRSAAALCCSRCRWRKRGASMIVVFRRR